MKLNRLINSNQHGFTLLELLTVIAMMGIIASIFIANFNAQRAPRDLSIARNETVTNARKVQSYTLSSRDSPGGAIKYYVITYSKGTNYYFISSVNQKYELSLIETVNIPKNVSIDISAKPAVDCAQVIFATPFGKMYLRTFTSLTNFTQNPQGCIDEANLKVILKDPIALSNLKDNDLTLKLSDSRSTLNYYIKFFKVSGKIDVSNTP